MAAKNIPAKKNAPAAVKASKPAAPVAPPAPPAVNVPTLPAGVPSRAGSRGRAEFDPATHNVGGIVVPAGLAAMKTIQAMHAVLLANPDKFVSRSQLAAVCLSAGVHARNGAEGLRHTATCQTGNQGTAETGFVFGVGSASDGEKGYRIEKISSELACVAAIKPGVNWDGQSKAVRKRGADGFPWALLTAEAKAAGFRGTKE